MQPRKGILVLSVLSFFIYNVNSIPQPANWNFEAPCLSSPAAQTAINSLLTLSDSRISVRSEYICNSFRLATQPYCSIKDEILMSTQREGKAFQIILARHSGVQQNQRGTEITSYLNSDAS